MRILDRYITKSIIVIFLGAILIFCLLFLLIDSASNLDEYIDRKISLGILLQYYLAYLPIILVRTSSMACLIAALLTFSNLNAHNEVVVLRSSGMSFWQITRPAICFTLIVSAAVFLINERFIPQAEMARRQIKNENISLLADQKKDNKTEPIIENLTFYGLRNRLYFIDSFDPNTYELTGITIIGYDHRQEVKEKITALTGQWTGIAWKFFNYHVTTYSDSINKKTEMKIYSEKLVDIKETPEDFLKQRLNVNAMNIKQLRAYIDRFSDSGAKEAINNLSVDLHYKFAFPIENVVIVLVGLPLVLMTGRRKAQSFTSLGIAIAIGFLYYACNGIALGLGKDYAVKIPPIIAAWLTPMIFTFIAYQLIKNKFE